MDDTRRGAYRGPRCHPAHRPLLRIGNRPVILHVTAVTVDNRAILASSNVHGALRAAWHEAHQWTVRTYVIMPEHLQLFCAPAVHDHCDVRQWAGYWKRLAGDRLPLLRSAWIKDVWDTQMRSCDHYLRKLHYVRDNPVRRGLAKRWQEWPKQGCLTNLDWISD
mgnify:CR=1 FL=1